MTIEEIAKLDCDFLTVAQVAECLKIRQQSIREQVEQDVKWLGFPICRAGHRFRIPREGFLAWARGTTPMLVYDQREQRRDAD